MTVYLVISLPKIPYIHRIYMVLANPIYTQGRPKTKHSQRDCVFGAKTPHNVVWPCTTAAGQPCYYKGHYYLSIIYIHDRTQLYTAHIP